MKCVEDMRNGNILRVSNDRALKMVHDENADWEYCPKCIWKKRVRDAGKMPESNLVEIPVSDIEATAQHKTKFKKGKKATLKKRALRQQTKQERMAA